jgi:Xaa-Pro aminopeptidase
MRYDPIKPELFIQNRENLSRLLLPDSLAVVNANDCMTPSADSTLPYRQNSDLFYLTGINQEETILLLYPDAHDEKMREILFIRESSDLLTTWEGHKLTKEEARSVSGVKRVEWLSEFRPLFRRLMCECERVYLNSNEHSRAVIEVESRDARFIADTQARYPLHDYHRLARLLHQLRSVKSGLEIDLLCHACEITRAGFVRVCRFVRPGVTEMAVEAEYAHEFLRSGGCFAYPPIIASGKNACVLHYVQNDQQCRAGELLLLDVAAGYANYNADLTRTIPVNGRFSRRQRQVYNAVLRVMQGTIRAATPGKLHRDWQKEAEALVEKELVDLGLLKMSEIRKQDPDKPALKKYFMHGVGHPLGLDVHDVSLARQPFQPGWVLTVEPGIYIPEEKFAVRLENNIVVREGGNLDLTEDVPVEADEIEALMKSRGK